MDFSQGTCPGAPKLWKWQLHLIIQRMAVLKKKGKGLIQSEKFSLVLD